MNSVVQLCIYLADVRPTLDAPLKEGLAALAGPHAVVVPRGVVAAHGAETHLLGHLKAGRPRSGHRLPHPVRPAAGAALLLPGDVVLAGRDAGPSSEKKRREKKKVRFCSFTHEGS